MYNNIVKDISHAFEFMASCSKAPARIEGANKLYTSHEGLVLDFEEAMTREIDGKNFNLGAHMVWIGDRTRQLDGAHIEYVGHHHHHHHRLHVTLTRRAPRASDLTPLCCAPLCPPSFLNQGTFAGLQTRSDASAARRPIRPSW
jgi:hypothetical protein